MPLPNRTTKLNLILDLLLDFLLDCYILWDFKGLVVLKLCLTIKKILFIFEINLLCCFRNPNDLLIEYLQIKLFALTKDNEIMKKYLDNKDLQSLSPSLIFGFSHEIEKRNECEVEIMKIDRNPKKQSEQANKNNNESEGLKKI